MSTAQRRQRSASGYPRSPQPATGRRRPVFRPGAPSGRTSVASGCGTTGTTRCCHLRDRAAAICGHSGSEHRPGCLTRTLTESSPCFGALPIARTFRSALLGTSMCQDCVTVRPMEREPRGRLGTTANSPESTVWIARLHHRRDAGVCSSARVEHRADSSGTLWGVLRGKRETCSLRGRRNVILPGQYYDVETGLVYNYFRDYDPATDHYMEADPIGLSGGINPYVYAYANPLSNIDPDGTRPPGTSTPGISIPLPVPPIAVPGTQANTDWANLAYQQITNALNPPVQCKTCPACTPYSKGTVGYIGPHTDHDHYPIGRPHLNLFVVNQNPSTCKCFWNKNNPDVAKPPPDLN